VQQLSFVIPYYDNPSMLQFQYETWAAYPDELKTRIEIVIVDDGSPELPASEVPRPERLPPLKLFRILVDKPWNQHGARNLGAKVASGPWLFLTDIDHVLPGTSLAQLMRYDDANAIYTFRRLAGPEMLPVLHRTTRQPKPHPNTFAMTQDLYWKIGGYDEDFCGIHGTDHLFRQRAFAVGTEVHLLDVPVIVYTARHIADAATRGLPRHNQLGRGALERARARKIAEGRQHELTTLAFPWEQVL
jgi:hypothetical protein